MNRAESEAILQSDVSHVESRLYTYLRLHMDYKTGLVGQVRRISYQSIREHLEYTPERGSKDKPYSPSTQQISRLLRKLEKRQLIERTHKNFLKEHMVFRLILASTDLNRPNDERQGSDNGTATLGATRRNPVNTQTRAVNTDTMSDKGATRDDRHTSVTSDIDKRERTRASNFEQELSGRELTISESMRGAFFRKFGMDANRLENEFTSFRLHKANKSAMRTPQDWNDEWQRWIARSSIMNPSNNTSTRGQHNGQRKRNQTAEILDISRRYAERAIIEQGTHDDDD